MGAQAKELGIDHVLLGRPMSFWKGHMPQGMVLRSGCSWHLDPMERDTIGRFLETRGQTPADVEPLPLDFYLEYAEWFEQVKGIRARPSMLTRLDQIDGRFAATLDDGSVVTADRVLLALGFAPFAHIPDELAALVPTERSSHTCDCVAPGRFAGQRVLIVGGRQSAFESAALLAEAGAARVHVCHRHQTPSFTASDWSWVDPLVERIGNEPGWYRGLADVDREALNARFWAEGRLKLEPWLGPRVRHDAIAIHPRARVIGCEQSAGALQIRLDTGDTVEVDHVLYATGYKVNLRRASVLEAGNLLDRIECRDGFPALDNSLQTTVPGLFVTSLAAARDFGLFFAFTAAVRASARIIARAI
jgi:cation diffusion facilitator CzcD-associated flavoprotein CzcO